MRRRVAFLFLGETLLVPHLWPIVEALAEMEPGLPIDCWMGSGAIEALLTPWATQPNVRLRRAPGFKRDGQPAKLWTLARLAPLLARTRVAVCAEQTSLWLPRVLPFHPTRFVKTSHGVGSMSARDDPRRRAAHVLLVPGERERDSYLARGLGPERVIATGYVKSAFRQRGAARLDFAEERPVVLYAPHWQRHRSSWWAWGESAVRQILADGRYNLIFAPHQRLVEQAPEVAAFAATLTGSDVHCDLGDSFAAVDGSYTAAADIYLGDTSSQVVEFLMTPRPCVFLNPQRAEWRGDPSHAQWRCGEVVEEVRAIVDAVARASDLHAEFVVTQQVFAEQSLGVLGPEAARAAAREVLRLLA